MYDPLVLALVWCGRGDLNPHGFCPLPPQDSVSTKFHHFRTQLLLLAARATFARRTSYFCSPPPAGGGGVSACCDTGASLAVTPFITEDDAPLPNKKARLREVNMKIIAAATVILCRKGVAPALPKTVWLEPPKAAPILAPLPFWSNTIMIKAIQTTI